MNVIVNALPLQGLLTGISRYVRCLYDELQKLPDVSATFFNGVSSSVKMPQQAEPVAWAKSTELIWRLPDFLVAALRGVHWLNFERKLRAACKKKQYAVYHETGFIPPALPDVPIVYTLYDISLVKYRAEHPRERVLFFDFFFKRRRQYADHIITISEFMKQELIACLGFPPDRVTAIHLASDPVFSPRNDAQIASACSALTIPKDFLLCVGTLEPRKNIVLAIQALAQAKTDIPLVLTGWQGWGEKLWRDVIKKAHLEKRIFMTHYVSDEMLACLYSGARALVYPSFYEGFGLPVLEAMACGCPVVCARSSSLPEVAGDAALLVDPHDAGDCAAAVEKVVCDSDLHDELRMRGLKRASAFSWKLAARRTFEVFKSVADENAR
jgi:glycosyltransferase involved in cell wall biosynthesis